MGDRSDFSAGVLFLMIAIIVGGMSLSYHVGTATNMGAGFFPLAVSIVLGLCGAVLVVGSPAKLPHRLIPIAAIRPLLFILGSIVVFALMIGWAGLIPSVFVMTMIASLAQGVVNLRRAVLVSAVLSVAGWLIFIQGLGLLIKPLPWS